MSLNGTSEDHILTRSQLKSQVMNEIEKGRRFFSFFFFIISRSTIIHFNFIVHRDMNLDVVLRHEDGEPATLDNTGFIALFRMYRDYIKV